MREIDFLKVVSDEPDRCAYLPRQTARLPLQVPAAGLTAAQFDQLLAAGYRRSGWFFYKPQCPACRACEPLRIEVDNFCPSRSQRRAKKRGVQHLRVQFAPPIIDARRLEIFNAHRLQRQLAEDQECVDEQDYRSFLVHSYADVRELSLWVDERLVAVSITDVGACSLSAVYCFFDPQYAWLSPGTYAILQQIDLARAWGYRWLYLGLMVADNPHLKYKANFRPHQRRLDGVWQTFD